MPVSPKRLDVTIGDVVEIDRGRYHGVSDKQGGVALEPAITMKLDEIHAEDGDRPLAPKSSKSCSATSRATVGIADPAEDPLKPHKGCASFERMLRSIRSQMQRQRM